MFKSIALESLLQRGKSTLYTDMTLVYQEALDALYDSPDASRQYIYDTLIKIKFKNKLKTVVYNQMGFVLKDIRIDINGDPNLYASGSLNPYYIKKKPKDSLTLGSMMEQINRLYDDRKAKFIIDDYRDLGFTFTIALTASLFQIRNEDKSFFFTADELAALTLHELGHIDDYIRNWFRIKYVTQDASDIITHINVNTDPAVIKEIIKALKESKYIDKSWANVLKLTETYFDKSNSKDDPSYYEALGTLTTLIVSNTSGQLKSYLDNLENLNSNRVKTRLDDIDKERSADDFSARNGAYGALVSVLLKLDSLYSDKSYLRFRIFMWETPAYIFSLLNTFTDTFNISAEDIDSGYDPMIKRTALIVETAKHAFSDIDLSPEAMEDIKIQIKESEAYLRQYSSEVHRRIRRELSHWKDNVAKFGRILASPFQNRLLKDYERLQDATRTITRHPLYYLNKK